MSLKDITVNTNYITCYISTEYLGLIALLVDKALMSLPAKTSARNIEYCYVF